MLYNLTDPLQRENFKTRCNALYKGGKIVELTEKRLQRTSSQNRYLHVIIAYFASQYGETAEYVKQRYFKWLCNADIFVVEKDDPFIGRVKTLRSTSALDSAEMTTAIDRFRDWSAKEAGIYLPEPHEAELVALMELEIERNKKYI